MPRSLRISVVLLIFTISAMWTWTGAAGSESADSTLTKGMKALEAGRTEDAIKIFSTLIAGEPRPEYFFYRGYAFSAQGMDGSAIQDFTKAIAAKPDEAVYYLQRGFAFQSTGMYEKAVEDFSKTLELNPDNKSAPGYRARAYLNLGKVEEAYQDLIRAIELSPRDGDLYRLRGNVLSIAGRNDLAVKDFEQAIELKPNDAAAYNNCGVALGHLRKRREAKDYLVKAIEIATSIPSTVKIPGISGNAW